MTPPAVRDVLAEAVALGLVPAGLDDHARAALVQRAQDDLPWYLRALVGVAAWIAAFFLIGLLLGLATAITDAADAAALLLGLLLMPAGLLLARGRLGEFRRQMALVSVIAGQMCVIGGIGGTSSSLVAAALATIITSALLAVFFDESAYRFMATLAIVGAALAVGIEARVPGMLGLLAGATGVAPVVAWRATSRLTGQHRLLDPIAWACVVASTSLLSLQGVIDVVIGDQGASTGLRGVMLTPAPLTLLFATASAWMALQVARDHGTRWSAPAVTTALAVVAVVALLAYPLPAVSAALLFTALGFDRRRPGVVGLAAALLVGALGLYYYSLALTLFHKSLLLMASGAVCLGAAVFFRRQAREVVSA